MVSFEKKLSAFIKTNKKIKKYFFSVPTYEKKIIIIFKHTEKNKI
jgi:hypothetical protein